MPPQQNRLKEIFSEALAKSTLQERSAYLDATCADDPDLRQQVEALLIAHAQCSEANNFLQQNIITSPIGEGPGSVIGRYKILQQIGEGGFGVVFMAEQQQPVRRMVALKVIKAGMDTREVIARFEAERQALALMDHPNIARVLDGGATDSGRPYFVMDLVKGVPITEFCDQRRLSTAARLRLFIQVCAAVQHAHQKGVIHRDLKPTNILVTLHGGEPVPKVIDFGIAKAIGQRLTEKTLFTRYEQLMGTPNYMSPEQAEWSGLDIDTRSDIYSLGVLLYELLTGTTPLEKETLSRAAIDEMRRLIRETDPPAPSTRVQALGARANEIAAQRQEELPGLFKLIRGDLDWVVMKALEKDRARRYETINAFVGDLESHLRSEPVLACPPSAIYRARKFVRRHRVGVAIGLVTTLSLLAGLVLALAGFARARQESRHAQEQAATTQAINDFLENDFMRQADRWSNPDRDLKLRTVLDRASEKINVRFAKQPLAEASIRFTLGQTYLELNELAAAASHLARVVEIRSQKLGTNHAETLAALTTVARLNIAQRKFGDAEQLLVKLSETYSRLLGPENTNTLNCHRILGENYLVVQNLAAADKLLRNVVDTSQRTLGPDHFKTLEAMKAMAAVHWYCQRWGDAADLYEKTLGAARRTLGNENPLTLDVMTRLGFTYQQLEDLPKSAELLSEGVNLKRRINGPSHPETIAAIAELGGTYGRMARWSECIDLLLEACPKITRRAPLGYYAMGGAGAALLIDKRPAYQQFMVEMLNRFHDTTDPAEARVFIEFSLLVPDALPDLEPIFRISKFVPRDSNNAVDQLAVGMIEYRRGNLSNALPWFEQSMQCAPRGLFSQAAYFCTMTHFRLGAFDSARKTMQAADARFAEYARAGTFGYEWHEYPRVAVIRAEAQKLMGLPTTSFLDADAIFSVQLLRRRINEHLNSADHLASQRQWAQATHHYSQAMSDPLFDWLTLDPSGDMDPALKASITFLLAGDFNRHEQIARSLLLHHQDCKQGLPTWQLLKTFLIAEKSHETESNRSLIQEIVSAQKVPGYSTFGEDEINLIRRLAEYRAGQFSRILESVNEQKNAKRLATRSAAQIIHAMALKKVDRPDEARNKLAKAESELGSHLQTLTGDLWWDLAICQVLLDEAHRLFSESK